MPPRLVIEMAKHGIYWLNAFPNPNGVSDNLSPRTIITGQTVDFNRHCKYEFGQYVQTHEQHDNSMTPRTIGALAMRPTGNAQGNYYFFSLSTGRIINRVHATKLPMPDDVIERVHSLARRQKANPGLVFLDRNQAPDAAIDEHDVDDEDDDDSDYVPEGDDADSDSEDGDPDDEDDDNHDDDYDSDDDNSDYHPPQGADGEDDTDSYEYDSDDDSVGSEPKHEHPPDGGDDGGRTTGVEAADEDSTTGVDDDTGRTTGVGAADEGSTTGVDTHQTTGVDPEHSNTTGVGTAEETARATRLETAVATDTDGSQDQQALNREMDEKYGPRNQRYNMRQRREPNYSHLFTNTHVDEPMSTPQMNMRKGLKVFGEDGVAAVKKEMLQLHERKVMEPCHAADLTPEQKKEALAYLMFLKRK
jgi:hypothetical protein